MFVYYCTCTCKTPPTLSSGTYDMYYVYVFSHVQAVSWCPWTVVYNVEPLADRTWKKWCHRHTAVDSKLSWIKMLVTLQLITLTPGFWSPSQSLWNVDTECFLVSLCHHAIIELLPPHKNMHNNLQYTYLLYFEFHVYTFVAQMTVWTMTGMLLYCMRMRIRVQRVLMCNVS